jgi:MOSC domain-containing protein YiiM
MEHLTVEALEAGLDEIRRSPADGGRVELIVRRPAVDAREVLTEGWLDQTEGLVGDSWRDRATRRGDGSPDPDLQITVMNARVASLLAGRANRRQLAGDQLYVDLDLSQASLPPGTRLALGEAVIQISRQPHSGCAKFAERFGLDALRFVNSPDGRLLRLRGLNARVVVAGAVRVGDPVRKVPASA